MAEQSTPEARSSEGRRAGALSVLVGPRGYGITLVVGLVGAVAAVVGVARPWVSATAVVEGLPTIDVSADGSSLAPIAAALGFVLLAGFGAVVATRGWVRRLLGVVIVVCAVVVLVSALALPSGDEVLTDALSAKGWQGGDYDTGREPWVLVTAVGALLSGAAGLAVVRFGSVWPAMGSRYDAPTARADDARQAEPGRSTSEADLWQAIDRGQDPTRDSATRGGAADPGTPQ